MNEDNALMTGIPEDDSAAESVAAENTAPCTADQPAPELDETGKRILLPYHERYYLAYGKDERVDGLDLKGTLSFLTGIGFDGGELRQARQGKDYAANSEEEHLKTDCFCCYCGAEITGVEFYRMPDGRLRCTSCSGSLVNTKAELQSIYERVTDNLDSFFGASITVPIEIELLEERKLKKAIRCPLSEVDNNSMLVLGAAVNRNQDYSLYLENGAPRISVIATFAHELTHIWQYTHWDAVGSFPKCSEKTRLLIYEGMAKWVEIQYLYLIGETAVARREEAITRRRNDAYGIGFCIYEDQYPLTDKAMTYVNAPFTTDRYPIS